MNYAQAEALFSRARNKDAGKKIANNTYLQKRGEDYAVRLHSTDVVLIRKDGSYKLSTGGWKTMTTKARMNEFAPVSIWSKRGVWMLKGDYIFADGCVVKPDGTVDGAHDISAEVEERMTRKNVARYAKDFIDALYAGEIAAPGGGDCWHCLMKDVKTGKPIKDASHIRLHITDGERYFVPSLLWNALNEMPSSIAEKHEVGHYMKMHTHGAYKAGFIRTQLVKHLRRYVLRELGLSY